MRGKDGVLPGGPRYGPRSPDYQVKEIIQGAGNKGHGPACSGGGPQHLCIKGEGERYKDLEKRFNVVSPKP